ncbi:MAG TPA: 2-succinyl-5-enolpyruvyl-6-hydroxy-3-cyclohexene-1-carboxylic-acid synthase [Candidatus Hydrogenedentes bacterium]|nr:2-succinyl-5-enolpyruvyl-6-hydroxy-3-cyclohexene-1-carboxylic-acid synthase [Candidatus Hydrogenedentota bacterium]HOL76508.1 2-succinyl-5-enolpyruvyl-6-hydroxy-3-cyclohexene-1-carboxylic-acid synthase [Candidatus Hydrogenedentota bacterium]HPO85173.1 2-succinyl-5-enolpyruvyl-6-hydroxy-3-cyclohexene-1-carboxylic-acid synthase [Candidatus Hydrogenedentota bacterium]
MQDLKNLNYEWARFIVEELARTGVHMFFISPGARSAPLTAAVAANQRVKTVVHYDERGAAFCALGYAKSTKSPAALICTSGTATANYFPAVIEASYANVPLIILTADRPPELIDSGANQTIRQHGLYGEHVRFAITLACPTSSVPPETLLTAIDDAVRRALKPKPGPVHINCPFREPLLFTSKPESYPVRSKNSRQWQSGTAPFTTWLPHATNVSSLPIDKEVQEIADSLSKTQKGLVIAGHLSSRAEREAVVAIAETIQWPIFPDICSGLRLGTQHELLFPYYDLVLDSKDWSREFTPDAVLHVGGALTSKRLLSFLKASAPKTYLQICTEISRYDPLGMVTHRIDAEIPPFVELVLRHVGKKQKKSHRKLYKTVPTRGVPMVQTLSLVVEHKLDELMEEREEITEPAVCRALSKLVPENHNLFLGNSLPIREMDTFGSNRGSSVSVFANRGASGIDGNIATAVGIAKGTSSGVTVLLGDLAFLHDLNSLALLKTIRTPFVIIVLNNDGGGIFHFLDVAKLRGDFEPYFVTPHGMTFSPAADLFDLGYFCPKTLTEFRKIYQKMSAAPHASIIEVRTNREETVKIHERWRTEILRALPR